MLSRIRMEDFSSLVGTSLVLDAGGHGQPVRVGEVRALSPHGARRETPFTVVLLASPELSVPQGIYRLHHPSHGALELFLVPIGPDARGMRYEAIFN